MILFLLIIAFLWAARDIMFTYFWGGLGTDLVDSNSSAVRLLRFGWFKHHKPASSWQQLNLGL